MSQSNTQFSLDQLMTNNQKQIINRLLLTGQAKLITQLNNVSEIGFLCKELNTRLPKRFSYLDKIVENLPETKTSGVVFRGLIENLPNYDETIHNISHVTDDELLTLYSVLSIIVNRYIWCTGVKDAVNHMVIPQILASPLDQVSHRLGIEPILTHASVDLWNWHLKTNDEWEEKDLESWPWPWPDRDGSNKKDILSCLEINNTLTGSDSEMWFYKIMIAIEAISGRSVMLMPLIHDYYNDLETSIAIMKCIRDSLKQSVSIIKRMYERCDPEFFFNRLRIYLSGSKNENLPEGVFFDLGSKLKKYSLKGGSAAQSSLIQAYDIFFEINHDGHGKEFLEEMRNYMPSKHRKYLTMMERKASIKQYVILANNQELKNLYEECVYHLTSFRKAHLGLVHTYIMNQVKKQQNDNNAHGEKGSGGTSPVEFCQELINDTISKKFIVSNDTNNFINLLTFTAIILLGAIISYSLLFMRP